MIKKLSSGQETKSLPKALHVKILYNSPDGAT